VIIIDIDDGSSISM